MPSKPAVVHSDPEIMGGVPVLVGTRVRVKTLYDYLAAGDPLDDFRVRQQATWLAGRN